MAGNARAAAPQPQQGLVWYALRYAAAGIPVFPLVPGKKMPVIPASEGGHGWQDATTDAERIRSWWRTWPRANIGMPCGAISGFVVIDIDPRNGGSLETLAAAYPDLPKTRTGRTPSGGIHLWYRAPAGVPLPKDNAGKLGKGIDFCGDGSYVVVPPSAVAGVAYAWTDARECVELPASIVAAVQREQEGTPQSTSRPAREREQQRRQGGSGAEGADDYWLAWALEQAYNGNSDKTGFKLAQQLYLSRNVRDIEGTLRRYAADASFDPHQPFTDRDVDRWLTSAQRSKIVTRGEPPKSRNGSSGGSRGALALVEPATEYSENHSGNGQNSQRAEQPPEPPEPEPPDMEAGPPEPPDDSALLRGEADDNGNAEAMYRLFGRDFLYTPAYGWLQWLGTHWQSVPEPIVAQKAIVTLKRRRHAAVEADAEATVKATRAQKERVVGCYSLFKSYVIEQDVAAFDADPDLLNCRNGVLDLRTGQLTSHAPLQRFTYCVPADYDPHADKQPWERFVFEALGRDEDAARYFKLFAGYSLTGHTREEKMLYLYGPPRAGKGTVTETLLALLPHPLGTEVDFASFTAKRDNDSQNFDLAELKPSRLVIASESNKYQSLNPAKIKALTGGNFVRCAFKHKDMFVYRPQFKVWLVSNHEVKADADDDALWGRVQVFTFPHSHLGAEDVTLKARMRSPENLRGVLRWAVEGAMEWYRLGHLTPPESIVEATQAQRNAQDYIKQWIDECCTLDELKWCLTTGLRQSYQTWCETMGVKPLTPNDFADALVKRFGCHSKRQPGTGQRGYAGIGLGVTPGEGDE